MKCPICGNDIDWFKTPMEGICETCFRMPSVKLFKIIIVMKGRIIALEQENEKYKNALSNFEKGMI